MIARRCLAIAVLLATACAPVDDSDPASPVAAPEPEPEPGLADAPPFDDTAELRWVRANACEDQSPMSLTASDGTGLALRSVRARATIEGPIALTELHLSFDNPQDRQLEGRFAITLPPGAAISRFAMKIGGDWQEGEVVERQAARRAYEDFLHRRQDPALLEKDAGNVFRARVFPIPPRGSKELIISYSQTLPAQGEPWRLPLCGLPTLGELDVDVGIVRGGAYVGSSLGGKATSVQHLALREHNFSPKKDLEAWVGNSRTQGVRHGDLAIARIKPIVTTSQTPLDALTILFDTSASRALDFTGQVDRLDRLVAGLALAHPDMSLKVVAFDQGLTAIYDGPADSFGEAQMTALTDRGALGASDLHLALRTLGTAGLASPRVLLIGDGVATAGDTDAAALTTALRGLSGSGVVRFDALVDGGIQDSALLAQLTREALETDGILLDARTELPGIIDRLGRATRSGITVEVPGAEWVWPKTLDGVQSGDELLIYAQLPPGQDFEVVLQGASVTSPRPVLSTVPGPLLGRAHAEARIAALQGQLSLVDPQTNGASEKRAAIRSRIIELSTQHRVLSDYTALLVLETEQDYRRFGIERNALTEIMTVGPAGVDMLTRKPPRETNQGGNDDNTVDPGKMKQKKTATRVGNAKDDKERFDGNSDSADLPSKIEEEAKKGGPPPPPPSVREAPQADGEIGGLMDDGLTTLRAAEPEPEPPGDERSADGTPQEEGIGRPHARGSGNSRTSPRVPYSATRPPREQPKQANAWDGRYDVIMKSLAAGKHEAATKNATAWRTEQPGDVMALIALGETLEASGNKTDAARAYGSLIDLFPSRADLRRMAGERLERLESQGLALAIDTYRKALDSRPDQPSGARLLAYALAKQGKWEEAFAVLETALDRNYPSGRFAQVHRILREDLALIGKAWIAADASVDKRVRSTLSGRSAVLPSAPSTRFVLTWETDANDVDLHVYDAKGNHAYYSNLALASGGQLYADVTTGYGPECFTIPGKPLAAPYVIQAHYYSRGPMGYGMGKLQVLTHDGNGNLTFGDHPFVIMRDNAYVDLAKVSR